MTTRLRSRVTISAAVCALLLLLVLTTKAWGGYYWNGPQCISPGQAAVSGWNSWSNNVVELAGLCNGGNPLSGLTYQRTDYTLYTYVWSPCNCVHPYDFVDTRNISYGLAICKASSSNGTSIYWNYCWASA